MKASSSSRAPIVNPGELSLQQLAQWVGGKTGHQVDARIQVKRDGQGANVLTTGGGAIRRLQVALGRRSADRTDLESRAVVNHLLAAALAHPALQGLRQNIRVADRPRAGAVRQAIRALQTLSEQVGPGHPLRVRDLAEPMTALSEAIRAESAAAIGELLQRSQAAQDLLHHADIADEADFARTAGPVLVPRGGRAAPEPGRDALKKATAAGRQAQRYFISGRAAPRGRAAAQGPRQSAPELARARFLRRLGRAVRWSPTARSLPGATHSTDLVRRHPGLDHERAIGMGYLLALPARLTALHREALDAMRPLKRLARAVDRAERRAAKREAKGLGLAPRHAAADAAADRELADGCRRAVAAHEQVLAALHALAEELLTLHEKDPALADAGVARLQALGCAVLGMVHALTAPHQPTAQLYRLARLGADDPAKARRAMHRMLTRRRPAAATAPPGAARPLPHLPGDPPDTAGDAGGPFDAASAAIGWVTEDRALGARRLSSRHFEWSLRDVEAHRRRLSSGHHQIAFDESTSLQDQQRREREAGTVALNGDTTDRTGRGDPTRPTETGADGRRGPEPRFGRPSGEAGTEARGAAPSDVDDLDELDQILAVITQRPSQAATRDAAPGARAAHRAHQTALATLIQLDQLRIASDRIAAHDDQASTDWTALHGRRDETLRALADASLNQAALIQQRQADQRRWVDRHGQAPASAPVLGVADHAPPAPPLAQIPGFEAEVQRAEHELHSLNAQLARANALAQRTADPDAAAAVSLLETRIGMAQNRLHEIGLAWVAAQAHTRALHDPTRADEANVIGLRVAVERAEADVARLRRRRQPFERAHAIAVEAHNQEQKSAESRLQRFVPGKLESVRHALANMNEAAGALRAVTLQQRDAEARLQQHEQALQAARSAQAAQAPARPQSPARAADPRQPARTNAAFDALEQALNGTQDDWTAWVEANTRDIPATQLQPPRTPG